MKKAFTAFAASYFFIVFLKDGTAVRATEDASRFVKTVFKGGRRLTKVT